MTSAERSLAKLALEIVTKLDRDSSIWKKWEEPRDKILGAAIECWIPKGDMLDFLTSLPGPALTMTDLEQRMKCMIEEEYLGDPEPKLEAECLAICQAEKEAGTEMPTCSIPDDHIDPRRSALFMARSILREVREGAGAC